MQIFPPMKKIILLFIVSVITFNLAAQKRINPITLNADRPDLSMHKAVAMRNAGLILTLSGVGIAATGYITSVIWSETSSLEGWDVFRTLIPFYLGIGVGIPTAIAGIPLWVIGSTRINKVALAMKKFILPESSIALGLGLTLRF